MKIEVIDDKEGCVGLSIRFESYEVSALWAILETSMRCEKDNSELTETDLIMAKKLVKKIKDLGFLGGG